MSVSGAFAVGVFSIPFQRNSFLKYGAKYLPQPVSKNVRMYQPG